MTSFIIDTHSLYSYTSSLSLKHSLDGWGGDGGWSDPTAEPTWKGDDWGGDGGWPDGSGNKVSVLCTI